MLGEHLKLGNGGTRPPGGLNSAGQEHPRELEKGDGDELFIPSESGMQPTQRALELASAIGKPRIGNRGSRSLYRCSLY
jgi:hypothetical protein